MMKFNLWLSVSRICLLAVVSASLGTPAIAQGVCYMVTPEGENVNLEELCEQEEPQGDRTPNPNGSVGQPTMPNPTAESESPVDVIIIRDGDRQTIDRVIDRNTNDPEEMRGTETDMDIRDRETNSDADIDDAAETVETTEDLRERTVDSLENEREEIIDSFDDEREQIIDSLDEEREQTLDSTGVEPDAVDPDRE